MAANETVGDLLVRIRTQVMGTAAAKAEVTSLTQHMKAQAKSAHSQFQQMAGAYTAVLVGRRGLALTGAFFAPAVAAEAAMAKLRVETGASGAAIQAFQSAAGRAAAATAFGFTDAIEGLTELTRAGYDTQGAIEALTPVMTFAQVRGISVAESARAAGFAFKRWGSEGLSTTQMLNGLQTIATTTGFRIENVADVLAKVSTTMRGLSFADALPAFGLVARSMSSVTRAGTGMQQLMRTLADPGKQAALRETFPGVETLSAGRMRPILDIVADVAAGIDDMSTSSARFSALNFESRSEEAFRALVDAIKHGLPAYRDQNGALITGHRLVALLTADAKGLGSGLDNASKIMLGTFAGSLEKLTGAFNVLLVQVGMPWVELLARGLTFVAEKIETLLALMEKDSFVKWSVIIGATGAVLSVGLVSALAVAVGGIRILQVTIGFVIDGLRRKTVATQQAAAANVELATTARSAAVAEAMLARSSANWFWKGAVGANMQSASSVFLGAGGGATAQGFGSPRNRMGTAGLPMSQLNSAAFMSNTNASVGSMTRVETTTAGAAGAFGVLTQALTTYMAAALAADVIQTAVIKLGPETSRAIMEEYQARGFLNSAVSAGREAYEFFGDGISTATSLMERQQQAAARLAEVQVDLNDALRGYQGILSDAAKMKKWPPTVMMSDVRRLTQDIARLGRESQNARHAQEILETELLPVLAMMQRGAPISDVQATQALGAVQSAGNLAQLDQILPKASLEGIARLVEAFSDMPTRENALNTALTTRTGRLGEERAGAARDLLGVTRLQQAIEQQDVAVMNVTTLNAEEAGRHQRTPIERAQARVETARQRLREAPGSTQDAWGAALLAAGPLGAAIQMQRTADAFQTATRRFETASRNLRVKLEVSDETGGARAINPTGDGGNQVGGD